MKLVLLRHASRNPFEGADSGLNSEGKYQAQALLTRLIDPRASPPLANLHVANLPRPTHLYSSPKRRARETLTPLAEALQIDLRIEENLDERRSEGEGERQFEKRVIEYLSQLTEQHSGESVIFLCSHMDWLEVAMFYLTAQENDSELDFGFSNCQARVFTSNDSFWQMCKS